MTHSPVIDVKILPMKLSSGEVDYYVRIIADDRTYDVRKYGTNFYNRALYERDELRHALLGESKPDMMDKKYDDPTDIEPQNDLQEAARTILDAFPLQKGPYKKNTVFNTGMVRSSLQKLAEGKL